MKKAITTAKRFTSDHKQPINNTGVDKNFQTPIPVVKYMVSLIPKGTRTVLEPTPGEGRIVNLLQGYQITAPEDFFLLKDGRFDSVIMNPPFSTRHAFVQNAPKEADLEGMRMGYYILKQCMDRSDSVIALMPWFTITDSDRRLRELKAYGLKSITSLPRKTFGYSRIQTMILELRKGWNRSTTFKTLDWKTEKKSLEPQPEPESRYKQMEIF